MRSFSNITRMKTKYKAYRKEHLIYTKCYNYLLNKPAKMHENLLNRAKDNQGLFLVSQANKFHSDARHSYPKIQKTANFFPLTQL